METNTQTKAEVVILVPGKIEFKAKAKKEPAISLLGIYLKKTKMLI